MADTLPDLDLSGLQAWIAARGRITHNQAGDMLDEIRTVDQMELIACIKDAYRLGRADEKAGAA